ncbi:MAG TPA: type II secretion system protein [Verrucomicrobiae bacterium]
MKTPTPSLRQSAFTFPELLIVLSVMIFLGALMLPSLAKAKTRSPQVRCASNLKLIALSFKMFAGDNDQNFPYFATGSPAYQNTSNAWKHFLSISNELGSTKILMCPTDGRRQPWMANTFGPTTNRDMISLTYVQNRGVSYFLNVDASEREPNMVLLGDRNVFSPGQSLNGSLLELPGTSELQWTGSLHTNRGMVALSDGSTSYNMKTVPAWRDHPDKVRLLLP